MTVALHSLDHLVVATPDVDRTVADLQQRLGVTFLPGGRHPAWGTRNAILPLSSVSYLEVVGPDKSADAGAPMPTVFGISTLGAPRVATWAAKGTKLGELSRRAVDHGIDLGAPSRGKRIRPDGSTLEWELTDPLTSRESGILPFFIDWHDGMHPATGTRVEVSLARLYARHPDPVTVRTKLRALGLELDVEPGPQPELVVVLRTPRGEVRL